MKRYGETNTLLCPTGRGSTNEKRVLLLPSDTIRKGVYDESFYLWNVRIDSAVELEECSGARPQNTLAYSHFISGWFEFHAKLKISPLGSDFCDNCSLHIRMTFEWKTYAQRWNNISEM